jgi:hypothetical protein
MLESQPSQSLGRSPNSGVSKRKSGCSLTDTEDKDGAKSQRAALVKAQQLMRETELPDNVELESEIDEVSASLQEFQDHPTPPTLRI